ncbi:NADH dehydrogenase subunit G [compost metagenome]
MVRPLGETRPAWKVLRVLGNLLGLAGFDHDSADDVKREALGNGEVAGKLGNQWQQAKIGAIPPAQSGGLQRIAEVPVYAADAIVRRARSLQLARDAAPPVAWMNRALFDKLGLREGDGVRVRQGGGEAVLAAGIDDKLPANCMRIAAARPETAALGALFGAISAERVPAREKVAV